MSDDLKIPDDLTQYYDDAKRRAAGRLSLEVQLIERVIALERALRDARINVQYAYLPENCGDHCRNNCRDCVLKNTLDDIDAALGDH